MNIFEWLGHQLPRVAEHDPTLVDDIVELPTWASNGQQARVRAVLPRIVATARQLDLPWIEVFARHWGLQSSVVGHYRMKEGLREAVSLLERAHRPDARDCPQSICVTQDLCIAYGLVDGPGFAAEREQAVREALSRIDPQRPCWRCLGEELVDALIDADRADEAWAWVDANFDAERRLASPSSMARLSALLGRHDEARVHVERGHWEDYGDVGLLKQRMMRAWVAARAGRFADAAAAMPPWTPRLAEACETHEDYVEVLAQVIEAGQLEPSVEHTQQVTDIAKRLRERGAVRPAVHVALMWARHVLGSGEPSLSLARVFLGFADALLPELRTGGDAQRAEAIRAELSSRSVTVPETFEAAEAWAEADDTTLSFDIAEALVQRYPQWSSLVLSVADHWTRRGWPEEADRVLQVGLAASPDDVDLHVAYLEQLASAGDWERLETALADLPSEGGVDLAQHGRWYAGRLADARGDVQTAEAQWLAMIDADVAWCGPGVFERVETLLVEAGRPDEALALWNRGLGAHPDWTEARWRRIVLASRLGAWTRVREDAAVLELPVDEGEGPIDELWGPMRLVLPEDEAPFFAMRTGPATGRVRVVTAPRMPERFGEHWVFWPSAVAEDEGGVRTYRGTHRLALSDCVGFTLDGAALSEAAEAALRAFADGRGAYVGRYSSEAYVIRNPDDGVSQPAQYYKIACPKTAFVASAWHSVFEDLAARVDGPLVWIELWEHLPEGDAKAHQALAEAWGMV